MCLPWASNIYWGWVCILIITDKNSMNEDRYWYSTGAKKLMHHQCMLAAADKKTCLGNV